jgi:hypothetical protein
MLVSIRKFTASLAVFIKIFMKFYKVRNSLFSFWILGIYPNDSAPAFALFKFVSVIRTLFI